MIALKDSLGSDFVERVRALFSENGPLSKAKNFEFRPQQQEMAMAVAHGLEEERHLVVEAGTGVGKSLAYLAQQFYWRSSSTKRQSSRRTRLTFKSSFFTKTSPF